MYIIPLVLIGTVLFIAVVILHQWVTGCVSSRLRYFERLTDAKWTETDEGFIVPVGSGNNPSEEIENFWKVSTSSLMTGSEGLGSAIDFITDFFLALRYKKQIEKQTTIYSKAEMGLIDKLGQQDHLSQEQVIKLLEQLHSS